MSLTSLIFLTLLGLVGIIYFFIGMIKKDYPLLICGLLLGVYSFLVKDIVWLSVLGLFFLLSPFALSRILNQFLVDKKEEKPMDPVLLRRSVRKYTPQAVSAELIEYLLEAAQSAPSAGNESPWHFVVINSKSLLEKISSIHPDAGTLKGALVAIAVCCDMKLEEHKGFWVQDCSAATENILIAAKTKGLGSVWLGFYPRQERVESLRKLLWLPENIVPFSVVALGYPAEDKPYQKRFNSQRVHYNGW